MPADKTVPIKRELKGLLLKDGTWSQGVKDSVKPGFQRFRTEQCGRLSRIKKRAEWYEVSGCP
jgi:hypothetical protein